MDLGQVFDTASAMKAWGIGITVVIAYMIWSFRKIIKFSKIDKLGEIIKEMEVLTKIYVPRDAEGNAIVTSGFSEAMREHYDGNAEMLLIMKDRTELAEKLSHMADDMSEKADRVLEKIENMEALLAKQGGELEANREELHATLKSVHDFMMELSKSMLDVLKDRVH